MNDDMNTPRSEGDAFGAPMEPIGPETAAAVPTDATGQPSPEPVGGDPGAAVARSDAWTPSWKTWVAVGVGAAAVGAAAVFGISAATSSDSSDAAVSTESSASGATGGTGAAQSPDARRGFAGAPDGFGTIATIDGSSLTIEDQSGSTTKVVTTDDTTVTVSVEGTVDDIAVGDTVMVFGEGTSTIAATRITDSGEMSDAEQGPPGGFRNGTPPQMPDGQALPDGQAPPGGMNGTPPQMPDGQAPPNGQGPGGPGGAGFGTRGVVKSVGDGTFTVTGMDDTEVTVTTSSSTEVTITKTATLGDLAVGDSVIVLGTESDGTLTATAIREGELGGLPRTVPGDVSTSGDDSQ